MDYKILLAIISTAIGTLAFLPYIVDIIKKRTKPHSYTWLIWFITQGTAVAGILYGGGGIGVLSLITGTVLVFLVFLLSLKYGTTNITKFDTGILVLALLAIVVWWKLHNPLLAVIMVSGTDLMGYIPSFRKSYYRPWDETITTWLAFVIGNILAITAFQEYNALTLTYIISITIANFLLALWCLIRRQHIPKPDN